MPKADVTYNTIGFTGSVGSGKTFTLYLDDEKTGSKTYHVYFKQLGGTGKLTLTTGKTGATNLVMEIGTYVAIISVDENGNIVNVASTPTDTISSGNNQPATSDGVYKSIKLIDVNEDYLFVDRKCLGTEVDVKNRTSTESATWQPLLSVLYKDGKWNSFGFFKNLPAVGNDVEESHVVLSEIDFPIRIGKKTIVGTTNPNGIIYSGNSNLDGSEIFLNAVVTSANDYKTVVGRWATGEQWLQIYNYDNTLIANTQVTIEAVYFSR